MDTPLVLRDEWFRFYLTSPRKSGMSDSTKSVSDAADDQFPLSPTVRSSISLALVVHLFCLFACAFSVIPPSEFHARLLGVLAPYVQLMNFDLDQTPYYLTMTPIDRDTKEFFSERSFRFEVLPKGADPAVNENWIIVKRGIRGLPNFNRYGRLAATASLFSEQDDMVGAIASDVVRYMAVQQDTEIGKIRLRIHLPIPRADFVNEGETPVNVDDDTYYRPLYTAIVLMGPDGDVNLIKESSARESAPPESLLQNGSVAE